MWKNIVRPTIFALPLILLTHCQVLSQAKPVSTPPADWDPKALATAQELAEKLRKAGVPCEEFMVGPFAAFSNDYKGKLPLPGVNATCETTNEEDLTFEVFDSAAKRDEFITAKSKLLCKSFRSMPHIAYPGFPYVLGPNWTIAPDEKFTADRIAPILGGESLQKPCDD